MAKVTVQLDIDSRGAIQGVQQVSGEIKGLENVAEQAGGKFKVLGGAVSVALGNIAFNAVRRLAGAVRGLISDLGNQIERVQDLDSAYEATFRNVRSEMDAWVQEFTQAHGFTTSQAREIATEIGGISLSLGETERNTVTLVRESAHLAMQWERIAGMDFANAQRLIALAMAGNISQLQRMGILSDQLTMTQFRQLAMSERLAMITAGLTARYGDLDQATDGVTQRKRQLIGRFTEARDNLVKALIPAYEDLLLTLTRVMEGFDDQALETFNQSIARSVEVIGSLVSQLTGLDGETATYSSRVQALAGHLLTLGDRVGFLIRMYFGFKVATMMVGAVIRTANQAINHQNMQWAANTAATNKATAATVTNTAANQQAVKIMTVKATAIKVVAASWKLLTITMGAWVVGFMFLPKLLGWITGGVKDLVSELFTFEERIRMLSDLQLAREVADIVDNFVDLTDSINTTTENLDRLNEAYNIFVSQRERYEAQLRGEEKLKRSTEERTRLEKDLHSILTIIQGDMDTRTRKEVTLKERMEDTNLSIEERIDAELEYNKIKQERTLRNMEREWAALEQIIEQLRNSEHAQDDYTLSVIRGLMQRQEYVRSQIESIERTKGETQAVKDLTAALNDLYARLETASKEDLYVPEIEIDPVHAEKGIEDLMKLFRKGSEDMTTSIRFVNFMLSELNKEIEETGNKEQREQLIKWREEIEEYRRKALAGDEEKKSIDDLMKKFREGSEDMTVSISFVDSAISRLNKEIKETGNKEQREQLIKYREELEEYRLTASGAAKDTDHLNLSIIQLLNGLQGMVDIASQIGPAFEAGIGSGLQSIGRFISQAASAYGGYLIAKGSANIASGAFPPNPVAIAAGKAQIATGKTLLGVGAAAGILASAAGFIPDGRRGGRQAAGASGFMRGQSGFGFEDPIHPRGGIDSVGNMRTAFKQALQDVEWHSTTTISGEDILISQEKVDKRNKRLGVG